MEAYWRDFIGKKERNKGLLEFGNPLVAHIGPLEKRGLSKEQRISPNKGVFGPLKPFPEGLFRKGFRCLITFCSIYLRRQYLSPTQLVRLATAQRGHPPILKFRASSEYGFELCPKFLARVFPPLRPAFSLLKRRGPNPVGYKIQAGGRRL